MKPEQTVNSHANQLIQAADLHGTVGWIKQTKLETVAGFKQRLHVYCRLERVTRFKLILQVYRWLETVSWNSDMDEAWASGNSGWDQIGDACLPQP